MVSKKKKKIIWISIVSLTLIAAIAIGSIFIFRKNKNNSPTTPPAENVNTISSNVANKAIADGLVSRDYDGTYKFSSIAFEFSDKLTAREIEAIYKNKGVKDRNGLAAYLKEQEYNKANNLGEHIVISDGTIQKNTGSYENPIPVNDSIGTFVGNNDLSLVTLLNTNKQYYISLNYTNKSDAINVLQSTNTTGTKLFIFEKIYSAYDPELLLINITYIYDLVVIDNFNENIYDF